MMFKRKFSVFASCLLATVVCAHAGEFQRNVDYLLGSPAAGDAGVADLNHDGAVDVVVCTSGDVVSVLLGRGDGTFGAHVDYAAGDCFGRVAFADFNKDSNVDLAVLNAAGFSVLLGNGDGTFQQYTSNPVTMYSGSIATADVNGDGYADVIDLYTNVGFYYLGVFLGNGNGSFQPEMQIAEPYQAGGLRVADFNGDGISDIAYTYLNIITSIGVQLGNGDGSFGPVVTSDAGGEYAAALTVGYFDGDDLPDLAVAYTNIYQLGILLGNGDGSFQLPSHYGSANGSWSATVADFNGDGISDVATGNFSISTTLSVLLGNRDGTFQTNVNYPLANAPSGVAAADLNKDGAPDLMSPNDTSLSVFLNNGGTLVKATSSANPSRLHQSVTLTTTVAASISGVGTPTGTVTFRDGAITLGAVSITNGQASFTTSTLNVGIHKIQAKYSGDGTFNPQQAVPVVQKVQP